MENQAINGLSKDVLEYVTKDGLDLSDYMIEPIADGVKLTVIGKSTDHIPLAELNMLLRNHDVSSTRWGFSVNDDLYGRKGEFVPGIETYSTLGHCQMKLFKGVYDGENDIAELVLRANCLGLQNDLINLPGAAKAFDALAKEYFR